MFISKDNIAMKKNPIKASQIAKFLKRKVYGKDIIIKKPVPIYGLSDNCLAFIKKEIFDQSLVDIISKHSNSLIICSSQLKDRIKSSYILSERPYYEFSRVLKKFFAQPNPEIIIGKNCNIHPTAIIGRDGFGYQQNEKGIYEQVIHIGGVRMGNNIDISSYSVIDRGVLIDTRIGSNVKIDSHVQVGHNCLIGSGTLIASGARIAGSTKIGKNCFIGLGALIKNKVEIGNNAFIGMGAVVIQDVPAGHKVFGNPARIIENYDNKK